MSLLLLFFALICDYDDDGGGDDVDDVLVSLFKKNCFVACAYIVYLEKYRRKCKVYFIPTITT